MMAVFGWQLPQSKRELLSVASDSENEHSISGIFTLLESSPELETLVIEGCATEEVSINVLIFTFICSFTFVAYILILITFTSNVAGYN